MDVQETFEAYISRNLHPETAQHIGDMVLHSPLLCAQDALAIIMEMEKDPRRKDAELVDQVRSDPDPYGRVIHLRVRPPYLRSVE